MEENTDPEMRSEKQAIHEATPDEILLILARRLHQSPAAAGCLKAAMQKGVASNMLDEVFQQALTAE